MEFTPLDPQNNESRLPVWGTRLNHETGALELGTAHCNREKQWVNFRPVETPSFPWSCCRERPEVAVAGTPCVLGRCHLEVRAPKGIKVNPALFRVAVADCALELQGAEVFLTGYSVQGHLFDFRRTPVGLTSAIHVARQEAQEVKRRTEQEAWQAEKNRKEAILAQLRGKEATIVAGALTDKLARRALRQVNTDGNLDLATLRYESRFTSAVIQAILAVWPEITWQISFDHLPKVVQEAIVAQVVKDPARFSH